MAFKEAVRQALWPGRERSREWTSLLPPSHPPMRPPIDQTQAKVRRRRRWSAGAARPHSGIRRGIEACHAWWDTLQGASRGPPQLTPSSWPQDFPILHLDGVVEDSSNILGFSMFNTSHPFYPEFVRSLNMSWRENCEASTYPGPAVSSRLPLCTQTLLGRLQASADHAQNPQYPSYFLSSSSRPHGAALGFSLTHFFLSTCSSHTPRCPSTRTPQGLCACSSCCSACTSPGN